VLIIDETGLLKKGTESAGVARQDSGTAGRVENSRSGVFRAYRSGRGAAFLDWVWYLPKAWAGDANRRRQVGVPEEVVFATKPELARARLRRAVRAGVSAGWVTADEVYGSDHRFRRLAEELGLGSVVAVTAAQRLFLGGSSGRANACAADLPGGLAAVQLWRRFPGATARRVGLRRLPVPDPRRGRHGMAQTTIDRRALGTGVLPLPLPARDRPRDPGPRRRQPRGRRQRLRAGPAGGRPG
jgi:hypothetical protein